MESWLLQHYELIWYLGFPSALLVAMFFEMLLPARRWKFERITRSFTNIGLFPINAVLQRAVFPILPITLAANLQTSSKGLLNKIDLPQYVDVVLTLLLLDLVIYLHHLALHKVPVLWRIHIPHHSDLDFDCTTGLRFHPLEAIFTLAISLLTVALFGLSPFGVLLFNLVHIVSVFFTHLNVHLPSSFDSILRLLIVTPDMHRVHHSTNQKEADSNYGTLFSWWDYLFRTYRVQAEKGYADMEIGIAGYRDPKLFLPFKLLILPFRKITKRDIYY
jgi:sterol desaturase/sphingolipid hydroxylase (fatty acid hydroxylase superfamily)